MAQAQSEAKRSYDLPRGDAASTLTRFAEVSGRQIIFMMEKVRGEQTNAIKGDFSPREALEKMLLGTALVASQDSATGAFVIKRHPPPGVRPVPSPAPKAQQTRTGDTRAVTKRSPFALIGAWLALAFGTTPEIRGAELPPPSTFGSISGTVANVATGAYLEGAQVVLAPGGLSTLSSATGEFLLPQVPPGTYEMAITYAGLDRKTIPVALAPNARVTANVLLSSEIYHLDRFVVSGEREGNAAAITQQRNAENIKTVMASDAFGNVADLNIVNFLMRMPGVTKTEIEGEPSGISIRGISNELSLVTIDGELGANASYRGLTRGFEADKISADFIESIEVVKSLTPDIDAGAVGGIVNMKTKSALARRGRIFTFQAGEAYNVWRENYRPFWTASFSDVIGRERNLGVLMSASYSKSNKPRDNSNMTYETTTATDRPVWFNAGPWGEDLIEVSRTGLSARVDYKLLPSTTVYLTAMYSHYTSTLERHRGSISNPTAANLVQVTDTVTEARNQTFSYVQLSFDRDIRTYNFSLGGESRILGGKLDFQATLSPSRGHEAQFNTPKSVAGAQLRQDRSATHNHFAVTQTGGPNIFDPRNMTMGNIARPELANAERVIGAQLNFTRPLRTRWPFTLKLGGRYRSVYKMVDQTNRTYAFAGPNSVIAEMTDTSYRHRSFDYPTDRMPFFDQAKLGAAMAANPPWFLYNLAGSTQGSIANDVKLTEDIAAAYTMGTLKLGRLTAVGGLRFEDTTLTGKGYKNEISRAEAARRAAFVGPITPEETLRRTVAQFGNPAKSSGGYRNHFPSVNFKYQATARVLARFGYAQSIGRPNLGAVRPSITVDVPNERVTANNPNLQPQRAENFDVSLEYYPESAGVVTLGGFQKNLKQFIFPSTSPTRLEPGNPYGDEYVGYSLTSNVNGGKAWVRGLEFAYQHQFANTALPSFLRRFGVFANFTWLKTEGNYQTASGITNTHAVPGFTPRSGNIGLSYVAHGWTIRAKAKYECARLEVWNNNPALREYFNDTFPLDVNVEYALSRRLRLFVDVINLFNSRTQDRFIYIPDRPNRFFEFSTYLKAGVSGRF